MKEKLVQILNPRMCLGCRFFVVEGDEENPKRTCTRRDCDNWDHSSLEKYKKSIEDTYKDA